MVKPKFHLARHASSCHDTTRYLAHAFWHRKKSWRDVTWHVAPCRAVSVQHSATRTTRVNNTHAAHAPLAQVRRSLADVIHVISSKQQCKHFVINDSIIIWLFHYVNITTLLISPKNVIDAVQKWGQSKLNTKFTEDNNWRWACWDMSPRRSSRHDNVLRVVTWRDGRSWI